MLVPAQCHRQVRLRHILKILTCACSIHNGLLLCVQFRWYLCVCVWFYLRHFGGGKKSNELEVEVFFGANENSLRLPSLLLHRPKSFPAKKIPCQTFFPTRHIRRLHTCEAWALNIIISQVCVIWKCYGLLLLSVHAISTKNHMMRIIPEMLKWKLLILYTYFHHHRHYLFFHM